MLTMETMSHCGMTDAESKSAAELRKQNKPLMEKRRRARINESLNKLKSLVLDAMKRDTSRYSKLEKADILEMTVKHLRAVQRQQMAVAMANDTTVISKYRAGFVECASEVTRYLSTIDGLDPQVRNRLLSHLSGCTQKVTSLSAMQEAQAHPMMTPMRVQIPSATPVSGLPGTGYSAAPSSSSAHLMTSSAPMSSSPPSGGDPRVTGAFHMVPGGLPGGQFALLVPSSDGGYALSTAAASAASGNPAGMYSTNMNNNNNTRAAAQSYRSLSTTSPGMTSPMSLTSPTSDHVFRYGSASDAESSDEEELEVALDMRVEPCRDVNDNVIKPGTSQSDYARTDRSPSTSGEARSRVSDVTNHQRPLPAQHAQEPEVKLDDMWRPW